MLNWLGNLLGSLLVRLSPLKSIAHWKIWAEMKSWYDRFKKWRDWYKQHVMGPMKQMQAMQRQLYNTFFKPLLLLVDHIRQLTSIVGIFNRKLANKLNYQFLKIESYILMPMNTMTSRVNALGRTFSGFLTILGYFDRATLLNSIWRDAGLVKSILSNPLDQHPGSYTLSASTSITDMQTNTRQYLNSDTGPYAADVDQTIMTLRGYLSGGL
jgi:hypothetical protein